MAVFRQLINILWIERRVFQIPPKANRQKIMPYVTKDNRLQVFTFKE